jgi:hypothetical protein
MSDIVWIPAVPLPMLGWRTDRCKCGQRFRGKNRRAEYELHYRAEHQPFENGDTQVGVPREEAAASDGDGEKQLGQEQPNPGVASGSPSENHPSPPWIATPRDPDGIRQDAATRWNRDKL